MRLDPDAQSLLQRRFLLTSVTIVSIAFLWMIRGFLMALLVAALAASLMRPVYHLLLRWLGGREALAAAFVVIATLFLVIGPAVGLIGLVVGQALEITQAITPWVQQQIASSDGLELSLEGIPLLSRLPIQDLLPSHEQLIESAGNAVKAAGTVLVEGAAAAGRTTASFFLQLFIMLYAMFFFLFDGSRILDRILYYVPLGPEEEQLVVDRFASVTRATLRGSILIGGLQGVLAGLAFWAAGIQGAAFWGTIMMVLSVIPGVGAPLIWLPATIWLLATGETVSGIGLGLWCALVVGSIDNVLRPRLVGSDAKMSDLMILLSTLGGIALFGPLGFIMGPILAGVFLTIWEIYGRTFAEILPATALQRAAAERDDEP